MLRHATPSLAWAGILIVASRERAYEIVGKKAAADEPAHPYFAQSEKPFARSRAITKSIVQRSGKGYDPGKEPTRIELRDDQLQALDGPEQPPVAVDLCTGQEYLLIKREVYELVRGILKPVNRVWNSIRIWTCTSNTGRSEREHAADRGLKAVLKLP
jgi:hypothetical protein